MDTPRRTLFGSSSNAFRSIGEKLLCYQTELSPRAAAEAERQREVKLSLTEGEQGFSRTTADPTELSGTRTGKELEYIQRSYSRRSIATDRRPTTENDIVG